MFSDGFPKCCARMHKDALALPALDESFGFEGKHDAPDGSGADLELIPEPGGRRQFVTRLKAARAYPATNAAGKIFVFGHEGDPIKEGQELD